MSGMWWQALGELAAATAGVPGGLAVEIDGELVEVGGVGEESVTLPHSKGMTILADLDGDGIVDHATMHQFSGSYEVWSAQAAGTGWGLPDDTESNPSSGWGMESDTAPGKGWENVGEERTESLWTRVDRG